VRGAAEREAAAGGAALNRTAIRSAAPCALSGLRTVGVRAGTRHLRPAVNLGLSCEKSDRALGALRTSTETPGNLARFAPARGARSAAKTP